MIEKNLRVIDILLDGRGVARTDTKTVFIEGAVYGEVLDCQITKEKKNFYEAKKIRTVEQSPDFELAPCPFFEACGGCSLQNISYEREIDLKERLLKAALKKNAGLDFEKIEISPSPVFGYRNKLRLQVDGDGSLAYLKKYSKDKVRVTDCLLAKDLIRENFSKICEITREISRTFPKSLREVTIRANDNQILLVLAGSFSGQEVSFLKKSFKNSPYNICLKTREKVIKISGEDYLIFNILGKEIKISSTDFYQVNDKKVGDLYRKAASYLDSDKRLLDLYCGSASSSIAIKGDGLVGVDINKSAIRDAKENAKRNGLSDYEFFAKDAKFITKDFIREKNIGQILLDPPRKGLDGELIEQISEVGLEKIVYISCNPQTLARDIKKFMERGYELKEISGFDLFPRSMHVETVVLMSRN